MHLQKEVVKKKKKKKKKKKSLKEKKIAESWRVEKNEAGITPFKISEHTHAKIYTLGFYGLCFSTTLTSPLREEFPKILFQHSHKLME